MSLAINVITGFLGSGKTTLLRRLLAQEALGETALLINEFGEVGIDHLLVEEVAPDTVLLPSGCVCCSVRGDLKAALLTLHGRRSRGEIPAFRRVLLETTGLADPGPILATLNLDPQLRGRFHLGLLVTVVDAEHAALQEGLHPEWLNQVTAADRLLLSKADRVAPAVLERLDRHLAQLNPTATRALAAAVASGDDLLLGEGLRAAEQFDKLNTEVHSRFSLACSCFFFALLGGPFAVLKAKAQFLTSFLYCFVPIVTGYYPLVLSLMVQAKKGHLDPSWSMWVGNAVLALTACVVLRRVLRN